MLYLGSDLSAQLLLVLFFKLLLSLIKWKHFLPAVLISLLIFLVHVKNQPVPRESKTTDASNITTASMSSGGTGYLRRWPLLRSRGICWSTSGSPSIDLSTKTNDGPVWEVLRVPWTVYLPIPPIISGPMQPTKPEHHTEHRFSHNLAANASLTTTQDYWI